MRQTYLEQRMEAATADLERRMEAATEEAEINERGMNEAAEKIGGQRRRRKNQRLPLVVG